MMKKMLAILLAVVMMSAVCVPAFATDITKDSVPQYVDDVRVYTDTTGVDDTYTVTIPAEVAVPWGDTNAQDAGYTVACALAVGVTLEVSAAANDSGVMTAAGTSDTLTFTVQNGAAKTFTGYREASETIADNVTVTIASFQAATGTYEGTMTYTVTYTA